MSGTTGKIQRQLKLIIETLREHADGLSVGEIADLLSREKSVSLAPHDVERLAAIGIGRAIRLAKLERRRRQHRRDHAVEIPRRERLSADEPRNLRLADSFCGRRVAQPRGAADAREKHAA